MFGKLTIVNVSLCWLFLRQMFAIPMSQNHVCYVSASVVATKSQRLEAFSVAIALVLVQCAWLNHGLLIGIQYHLASVTTFIVAMVLLDILIFVWHLFIRRLIQSLCARGLSLCSHTLFSHSVVRTIEGFVLRITSLV